MSRIPYQPADLDDSQGLAESIRKRRGGKLYNLDRMLLHSPPLASGWHRFIPAMRNDLAVEKKLTELAICLIAVINEAEYEFHHHAPMFRAAGGTHEQLRAIQSPPDAVANEAMFTTVEIAVLRLTIEMTESVKVSDATFTAIRNELPNEQQLVELIGIIAAYNMVSRFLVALGIAPEQATS